MFVRQNRGLSGLIITGCRYHVLGVDNVLRAFDCPTHTEYRSLITPTGTVQQAYTVNDPPPLQGDRAGYNMVIRTATGAYEYIVAGMPHPDSALSRVTPVPNQPNPTPQTPWVPPSQQTDAPAAPAPAPVYSQGSQVDVTTGTLIPMVNPNQNTGVVPPAEEKSGSGLLVILALAAAVFAGG